MTQVYLVFHLDADVINDPRQLHEIDAASFEEATVIASRLFPARNPANLVVRYVKSVSRRARDWRNILPRIAA